MGAFQLRRRSPQSASPPPLRRSAVSRNAPNRTPPHARFRNTHRSMFEGEERWSRACSNGIGLSNYKNVYRDGARVGNWQEDLFGHEMHDGTMQGVDPEHFTSTQQNSFDRKSMADLERGSAGVESVPYEMLFGHGKVEMGDAKASNAEASMTEMHFTKPEWE